MKASSLLIIISLVIISAACSKKQENQVSEKPLYDQVMEIHDEVMPSMGELNRLKRELKDKLAAATELTPEERAALEQTIQKVESASDGMMIWMREFNPEDYEGDALQQYLEGEMIRVQKVKKDILEALEAGRKANQ